MCLLYFICKSLQANVEVQKLQDSSDSELLLLCLYIGLNNLFAVVSELVPLVLLLKRVDSELKIKILLGLANIV